MVLNEDCVFLLHSNREKKLGKRMPIKSIETSDSLKGRPKVGGLTCEK